MHRRILHIIYLSIALIWTNLSVNAQMTKDSYFYRLFCVPTYYSDVVKHVFQLDSTSQDGLNRRYDLKNIVDNELLNIYIERPALIRYHERQFDSIRVVEKKHHTCRELDDLLKDSPASTPLVDLHLDLGMHIRKPNFWKTTGNFSIKFSQNYFSENWYKGGSNNQTLLSSLRLEAKYDDTKKFQWENRLDMKLGFITSASDTCHSYIIDNDRLDAYSKIGYKINNKHYWYYTLSLNAITQFTPGYRVNQRDKFSDFLSPLDFYLSVGLDYKPKVKNGTLSVAMLPLSYKFRYLDSHSDNIHNVYNMSGQFHQDWGSRLEVNANFKLAKNITWRGKFYAYTSYKYFESELENVLNYTLSKYLSAEVYTLWRFDDNRSKMYYDDNLGYFQFKEYFTFGLNYTF